MFKYYYVDENNLNVVDKIRYSAFAIWLSIVKFLFFFALFAFTILLFLNKIVGTGTFIVLSLISGFFAIYGIVLLVQTLRFKIIFNSSNVIFRGGIKKIVWDYSDIISFGVVRKVRLASFNQHQATYSNLVYISTKIVDTENINKKILGMLTFNCYIKRDTCYFLAENSYVDKFLHICRNTIQYHYPKNILRITENTQQH